jgi:hypothetical protein
MRGFNPSGKSPALEEYQPHPEELAKQASRRMDTTHGLAAILRDARNSALLRMRSEPRSPGGAAPAIGRAFARPVGADPLACNDGGSRIRH